MPRNEPCHMTHRTKPEAEAYDSEILFVEWPRKWHGYGGRIAHYHHPTPFVFHCWCSASKYCCSVSGFALCYYFASQNKTRGMGDIRGWNDLLIIPVCFASLFSSFISMLFVVLLVTPHTTLTALVVRLFITFVQFRDLKLFPATVTNINELFYNLCNESKCTCHSIQPEPLEL